MRMESAHKSSDEVFVVRGLRRDNSDKPMIVFRGTDDPHTKITAKGPWFDIFDAKEMYVRCVDGDANEHRLRADTAPSNVRHRCRAYSRESRR